MNAIDFLIKEHEKVKNTFSEIADPSHKPETKRKMLHELCGKLLAHETMEETLWYPNFARNDAVKEIVKHLIAEEKEAEKTIHQFEKIVTQEEWEKKFIQFRSDVEHHAAEEEHKLFPKVRQILNENDLESIGKKLREFMLQSDKHQ